PEACGPASAFGDEADLVRCSVDSDVGDLGEVDRDLAVLALQVLPAAGAAVERGAEILQRVLAQLRGQYLAADEADVDPFGGHQCAGCTISVSTLPVERGWTKATRLFRMPTRGSASISSIPSCFRRPNAASMSSTA